MSLRQFVFLTIMALIGGSAPIASADPARDKAIADDLSQLTGTWKFVALTGDGDLKILSEFNKSLKDAELVCKADGSASFYCYNDGERFPNPLFSGTFEIDPTLRPKTVDLVEKVGKTLAIYEFNATQLKLCIAKLRPTEFDCKPGTNAFLLTFQRAKTP